MNTHPRPSAITHFSSGFLLVVAAALLTWVLHGTSLVNSFEMTNLDAWFQIPSVSVSPPPIVIVKITDDDYHQIFGGRSPLAVKEVVEIIVAITRSGAREILVDLDTSGWSRREIEDLYAKVGLPLTDPPAGRKASSNLKGIVWARGGREEKNGRIKPNPVPIDSPYICYAQPVMALGNDCSVREFKPYVISTEGILPSMAAMAVALFDEEQSNRAPETCAAISGHSSQSYSTEERLINYSAPSSEFDQLTAGAVVGASKGSPSPTPWMKHNPIKDQIVILGGSYREARDQYKTPIGYLDGVDILADTVISSFRSQGILQGKRFYFLVLDLLLGMTLITLTYFVRSLWTLSISLVAIPIVSVLASFLIFRSFGYFISFVPVLIAVFVHDLFEFVIEHRKLRKEIKALRTEAAAIELDTSASN